MFMRRGLLVFLLGFGTLGAAQVNSDGKLLFENRQFRAKSIGIPDGGSVRLSTSQHALLLRAGSELIAAEKATLPAEQLEYVPSGTGGLILSPKVGGGHAISVELLAE
jgi:hypothetical protein